MDRGLFGLTFEEAREVVLKRRLDESVTYPIMTKQAIAIGTKIAEVDALLTERPKRRDWVVEVHPELSFLRIATTPGSPFAHGLPRKKRTTGYAARLGLVAEVTPDSDAQLTAITWHRADVRGLAPPCNAVQRCSRRADAGPTLLMEIGGLAYLVVRPAYGDEGSEPRVRQEPSPRRQTVEAGACRLLADDRVKAARRGDVAWLSQRTKSDQDGHSARRPIACDERRDRVGPAAGVRRTETRGSMRPVGSEPALGCVAKQASAPGFSARPRFVVRYKPATVAAVRSRFSAFRREPA
jgi:Protein of unknown function (DUF429)